MERTFEKRLYFARKAADMTMTQLAEKSGMSRTTIWNWEHGKYEPTFFMLCCVAKALNVSMDYLAGFCDYKRIK